MPDDCYELQALRAIHDTIVTWNDDMKALVEEYYHIAPEIVKKINAQENSGDIWEELYVNLVQKCVTFYEKNDIEGAIAVYTNTVRELKKKDCGE